MLSRLSGILSSSPFHVICGGCWHRMTNGFMPDAGQLDSEQSVDLYRRLCSIIAKYSPIRRSMAAILRNLDEPEATGSFIAPDGQTFTITEDAYPRSQLPSLRRGRFALNRRTQMPCPRRSSRPAHIFKPSTRALVRSTDRILRAFGLNRLCLPCASFVRRLSDSHFCLTVRIDISHLSRRIVLRTRVTYFTR